MIHSLDTTYKVCPDCRVENSAEAKVCWLCFAPITDSNEVITAELVEPPRPSPLSEAFFLSLTLACLALAAIAGIGLAQEDLGLLIPYMIFIAPAILATVSRMWMRARKGKHMTAMEVFLTLLISTSATVAIVGVLLIAAVVAFFVYCIYALSTSTW